MEGWDCELEEELVVFLRRGRELVLEETQVGCGGPRC